jgi:hypothetical protein
MIVINPQPEIPLTFKVMDGPLRLAIIDRLEAMLSKRASLNARRDTLRSMVSDLSDLATKYGLRSELKTATEQAEAFLNECDAEIRSNWRLDIQDIMVEMPNGWESLNVEVLGEDWQMFEDRVVRVFKIRTWGEKGFVYVAMDAVVFWIQKPYQPVD